MCPTIATFWPFLIVNETDSSALQKFLEGRTLILITHRFSLIRLVDDVIVLDHGHLIEEGTVDSLLHKDGKFANLYKYQRMDDEVL